jgi:HKD family nuclease
MEIRHQPFDGALGDTLIERLDSGNYQKFEFMVAFAKQSGVLRIKPALERFRAAGGLISAFVGIDMDGTSYDALISLLAVCDELFAVHTESASQTFHSKVWALGATSSLWITVGSNNLTYSGLWRNFESSATETLDLEDPADLARASRLESRFTELRDETSRVSRLLVEPADVELLKDAGYVKTEVSLNVSTRDRQKEEVRGSGLFATEVPHPTGPAIRPVASPRGPTTVPTPVAPVSSPLATWVGEVFWTESGAMTSAARNQLDLSMSGRVDSGDAAAAGYEDHPGWAVGSVSFFGVTPAAQLDIRNVTLNFLGQDYQVNRVYFPGGNGTWRIQLNGESDAGVRLDHLVGAGGFVQKILTFQRIAVDYYTLTILEPSQLGALRAASSFVARNGGANGKLYGVFTAVE